MYLLVLALVAAGAAVLAFSGIRLARGRHREEPSAYCRCPHCRQKLRYRLRQVSGRALCPRCVRTFHFPSAGLGTL
jgi:hypothetical protein